MASPLLPYANSAILIESQGSVTVENGRIASASGPRYLIKAFLKREQSSGTDTGSTKIPLRSQVGDVLPGASGDSYLYSGYALQYAIVPPTFVLGTSNESGLAYQNIQEQFPWALPGQTAKMRFGNDPIMTAHLERSSGVYGGVGIDDIIYYEIGGVSIKLVGAEITN
jgi:hypothetical protein